MSPLYVMLLIREAYGSAAAFEREHKLPEKSVHDVVMRNRPSARVQGAIDGLLANKTERSEISRNFGLRNREKSRARRA